MFALPSPGLGCLEHEFELSLVFFGCLIITRRPNNKLNTLKFLACMSYVCFMWNSYLFYV